MKSIILSILLLSTSLFSKDDIQPLTEAWTPYQIETTNGLKGISIDLIKQIQKRIGNTKDIKVFPWKRSYNITLRKKGYALFLTTRSEEREHLFKWVGPIASMKLVFFKNASRNDLDIKNLDDAKKVRSVVVAEDTIAYQKLKKFGFKNLEINTLASHSFTKLKKNKTDLYPVEYNAFVYKLKQMQLSKKFIPVKMKKPIFESKLYIAFNKDTKDNVIKKWQKALDEIKNDGTYQKILDSYK
jgi:polar amino acid transport system substrate-binding protein